MVSFDYSKTEQLGIFVRDSPGLSYIRVVFGVMAAADEVTPVVGKTEGEEDEVVGRAAVRNHCCYSFQEFLEAGLYY